MTELIRTPDDVFTEDLGRTWAGRMNANFDAIADAGDFLQSSHGAEECKAVLARIGTRRG